MMVASSPRLIAYYDSRYITGRFGDPRPAGRIHEGTDFSHSRTPGLTPVPALLDGTVTKVWVVSSFHGYGNRVDTATVRDEVSYAHLHARSRFRVGDRVAQGDIVGHEGMSGFVAGSCCHVEHAVGGRKRDPLSLIRDVLAATAGGTETRPVSIPVPTPPEEDPMRYLIQIDPKTDGRWFLADFGAGTAQRIHNGTQLDLIRRDPRVDQVAGPQPVSVLAGLMVTGEN